MLPPEALEFSFDIEGVDGSLIDKSLTEESKPSDGSSSGKSMWALFFIAFLSGFAALLTPCVFPNDTLNRFLQNNLKRKLGE